MRNASSYDLILARSAESSGYFAADKSIQPAQQLELAGLLFVENVPGRRRERQRVLGIDRELDAVVLGAQVARPMAPQSAATIRNRRADHDEARQVIAQRAEPIVNPRADRRKLALEHVPAGVELKLGSVVVVCRPHRANHSHVVDA